MSEIFVDTIRKTGGSLGTDIRIKNTSVYESDGGTSVTQNLVQGVAKAWLQAADNASVRDSINIASGTDDGTGQYTYAFTNNFSNDDYAPTTTTIIAELHAVGSVGTSSFDIFIFARQDSFAYADQVNYASLHGDLA